MAEKNKKANLKDNKKNKNITEIQKLRDEITKYNEYYYNQDESLISDVEYDKLVKKLEKLETKTPTLFDLASPTQNPGAKLTNTKFSKITHKRPMLSLANTYNIKDLEDFDKRLSRILIKEDINQDLIYALELKLDGLSISLHYEEGKLIQAVTRGDGKVGEDVTENIMQIKSIPHKLSEKATIEVRGEIVLPISEFDKLNKKRLENNEDIFANPRNAASGTLRQKDSNIVKERNLDGYIYYLVESDKLGFKTHIETIDYLEKLGFKTTKIFEKCETVEKLHERIIYWEDEKNKLDYETDGMVIKVNNLSLYETLGATNKAPRWAISYKFPAKQVTTKLNGITWQVGRTGKVTPVAELEEVEVSGSMVKRASLHNYDEILRKDIRVGDRVFIEKAAEIIPQVVKVVKEVRTGEEQIIELPTTCPVCEATLDNVEKIINYPQALEYLGIEKIGQKKADLLAKESKNIDNLMNMTLEELVSINTIGKKMGEAILEFFRDEKNLKFVEELKSKGVVFDIESSAKAVNRREFMSSKRLLDFISKDDVVDIKCINDDCPSKLQTKIEYFVSRDAMNIDGLGSKIVEKFIELGKIKDISDIYLLHNYREELENIDKMGEKSINNLINSVEASKTREYSKALYALGIPHMGKFLATTIANMSENIENLMNMSVENLREKDGVGEKVANSIYNFFKDEKHVEIIDKLKKVGVNFKLEEVDESNQLEEFKDKTFLATGKLTHFKRQEIKDEIEKLGGTNLNSVTKKLDYLIVGEKAGSKLKKAEELGTVTILTEEEFLGMIK